MAEREKSRILRIIHFLLLIVLIRPFVFGKVIYANDNAEHGKNSSNPHFLQETNADNSLWPLQVGQVWVYIVTDSREPSSPWTMELHILEIVNIESSDYYHIGSYDLRADELETSVIFINSDENFVYKCDEGEYSVWPRDEMVAEHVDVPYGQFDAVYYDEGNYYNYFVPGVGLVKTHQIEDGYTVTSELVDIHPAVSKTIIYVDDDGAGANDGSSWTDAFTFLQEALAYANIAEKPVEIRVAQGTYRTDQGLGAIPEFDFRTFTFQLINNVTLEGGYAGIGGADPNERNLQEFKTILSGDRYGDDGPNFADNSENSYHVVTGSGTDNTAVLDGFVITSGNANAGTFPDPRCIGGGMYNIAGSPKIYNCIFRNNYAFSGGAGMFNSDNSDPLLENCSFVENVTDEDGAGMTNFMGSDPVLTDCDFIRNKAEDHAGGMLNVAESNPVLDRCTFIANSAGAESQRHDGGGMLNDDGSPTLKHCLFASNTAGRNGGAINNKGNSNLIIQSCTFSENQAGAEGDGIYNQDANATLADCILWANGSDQIHGDANVSFSNVEDGFEGQGNIDADPLFADPNNGDYHLKSQTGRWDPNSQSWVQDDVTSPCIDAGNPNSNWSDEIWPHGGRINMGAYGGTRQASMSLETGGMTLPRVAFISSHKDEVVESFDSLLEAYGCPTTLIRLTEVTATPLDSYDLIIVANDTQDMSKWSDPNTVAAIEDSGTPVVGLGEGGYTFFGELGLAIGSPNGAHGSRNSIEVIDPNSSLFRTPYSIEIPEDRVLQLYTETEHVGLYLWPTIPETVTALAWDATDFPYYILAMEYNRYLFWGFEETPEKMTEIGKTLFINVVIWTANKAWESEN